MSSQTGSRNRNTFFRKKLIMPTEHGAWAWLTVPFAVGAGVVGQFNLPVLLALIAGLSAFFMRQPATVWLRAQRGKARRSDGPIAAAWTVTFGLSSLACLLGLLAMGRMALLWLIGPLVATFCLYLLASRLGRTGLRSLWMELSGAAALAMMAPVAMVAANGDITTNAWLVWGIMAMQNVLGALYVRLRIFDTHGKPINRAMIFGAHAIGFAALLAAGIFDIIPLLSVVPFAFFLIRVVWAVSSIHKVENTKRFGFSEMGIEIISGIWIAASYWLG